MQIFSFAVSSVLALVGIGCSVFGIVEAEYKPTAVGLVLIFGAGVFATLFLGTRWVAQKSK